MSYGWQWKPYVPVAVRRAKAQRMMDQLRKKGQIIEPVSIDGKLIARSFWGQSWCGHLEKFSDYENRLPRGRSYVRNGSVCHLAIEKNRVVAKVSGSEVYNVTIGVKPLARSAWERLRKSCTGRVASVLELLQGKLSDEVMRVVIDRDRGLFPRPQELSLTCSCPDWASMCKHVAAVLYGVGARLDVRPELLFLLRGVDHNELISSATGLSVLKDKSPTAQTILAEAEVANVFGIELVPQTSAPIRRKVLKSADTADLSWTRKSKPTRKSAPARETKAKPARGRAVRGLDSAMRKSIALAARRRWQSVQSKLKHARAEQLSD